MDWKTGYEWVSVVERTFVTPGCRGTSLAPASGGRKCNSCRTGSRQLGFRPCRWRVGSPHGAAISAHAAFWDGTLDPLSGVRG